MRRSRGLGLLQSVPRGLPAVCRWKDDGRLALVLSTFLALALGSALGGCGGGGESGVSEDVEVDSVTRVSCIGRVETEGKTTDLASEVTGVVRRIAVEAGGRALAGETVVDLSSEVEAAMLEQAEAAVAAQAAGIEASVASLAAARARAGNARDDLKRAKALYEADRIAGSEYDDSATEYEALAQDVARLEAELSAQKSLLNKYRADRDVAAAQLARRSVRAPADGVVLSLDIAVGSLVSFEAPFGTFAPDGPLTVWAEVDELFAGLVEVGQRASVRAQGTTEVLATGSVSFAGPHLREKSIFSDEVGDLEDRRVREVRIALDEGAELMLGSRVECVIDVQ